MSGKPNWGGSPQKSDTTWNKSGAPPKGSGWGGAPQKSDTSRGWGGSPQKSDTTFKGSQRGWGGAPQKSDTDHRPTRRPDAPEYNFYVLGNVTYRTVRMISAESGEAKIFEVEAGGKHYALKLYRLGIRPNHRILDKIMSLRGNGLLVDIYAHGTWHDDVQNADFDYEVMQLCKGGSLANLQINGREEELRDVTLRMTAAVDFLHKNGIIHRDVKPANFMFTDETKTQFVLTDWGFAKMLDKEGRTGSDDGRTKLYTAPELYINIPGQKTYCGPKADFFSLGMSMLALWKGEGLLIADEEKLVRQKLDEELPYPSRKEISEHMLSLMKALTRNNPDKRAGFEEVKRWAKGEVIYKDVEVPDDSVRDYKIIFSGERNLIAHNNKELAKIMWDNRELAKKYLYSDKIADWLDAVDRPEMAIQMRDITEMRYPGDQDAGLLAACMTLDPEMPYPVPVIDNGVNSLVPVSTLEEYKQAFYSSDELDFGYQHTPEFVEWATQLAPDRVGKALTLIKDIKLDGDRKRFDAVVMHFCMLPDIGFDGVPLATSAMANPERMAGELIEGVVDEAEGNDAPYPVDWTEFDGSWIHAYLYARGGFEEQCSWVHYCVDENDDDAKRTGPYDYAIAELKILAGWNGGSIPITVHNKTFNTADDVAKADVSAFTEDEQTLLANWLTLRFQEDPKADYKAKSFTKRTLDYYAFIRKYLPKCSYIADTDVDNIDEAVESNRKAWKKVKTVRTLTVLLCFIPMLCVCGLLGYMAATSGSETIVLLTKGLGHGLAIIVGIICAICCADGGLIGLAIGGAIGYGLTTFIFNFLAPVMPWVIIAILIGGVLYFGKKIFFPRCAGSGSADNFSLKHKLNLDSNMSWQEIVLRYRAGKSFDTLDKLLPHISGESIEDKIEENTAQAKKYLPGIIKSAVMMLLITIGGVAICSLGANKLNEEIPVIENAYTGTYSGDVQGTPSTIRIYENSDGLLEAEMKINYQAGTTEQTMVAKGKDVTPVTLYLKDNDRVKITLKDNEHSLEGTYVNSKGNTRSVKYTKTADKQ